MAALAKNGVWLVALLTEVDFSRLNFLLIDVQFYPGNEIFRNM